SSLPGPYAIVPAAVDSSPSKLGNYNVTPNNGTLTVTDTTGPTITVPANINTTATSVNGAVVTFTVTAIDAVDGPITPTCTPGSGSTFAPGTTTVTCTTTDAHHNTSTKTFTVTVYFNASSGFLPPINNPSVINT